MRRTGGKISCAVGGGLRAAAADIPSGDQAPFPPDDYQMPEWLHYARTVYFDGYSPPVYPHMKAAGRGKTRLALELAERQ